MAQIRIVRTIEYIGEDKWLREVLAQSLQVGKVMQTPHGGKITITSHTEQPLSTENITGADLPAA